MRKVLEQVTAAYLRQEGCLTYRELALRVYGIDHGSPTKAQRSAVARATRGLEQDFMVEIYAKASDQRVKLVGISPWLYIATGFLPALPIPDGAWYSMLRTRVAVLRDIVEIGAVEISVDGLIVMPHLRPLIIDTERYGVV